MSGIAGVLRFDGQSVPREQIQSMLNTMAYRGPDGMGYWTGESLGLGHAMLHTTLESQQERQPLNVPDWGLTVVMDGRVDNRLELRGRLLVEDAVIFGNTDLDLTIAAYHCWGDEFLQYIEGDFAVAIWNSRSRELLCARDRVGVKPFYYYLGATFFAFASEMRVLLDLPEISLERDKTYLVETLAQASYSRESTPWTGISRLLPAHRLSVAATKVKKKEYWQPDYHSRLYYPKDSDYVEHYRELLDDTVRRMSRSYGPLGCEVSGGLDSSAVLATAAMLHQKGRLQAPAVEGYTLDFSGDPRADEIDHARSVARHLGCALHEVKPTIHPLSWYVERARRHSELAVAPNGVMLNDLFETVRKRGSPVLLNGIGGDQWLRSGPACYLDSLSRWEWRELLGIWRENCAVQGSVHAIHKLIRTLLFSGLPPQLKCHLIRIKECFPMGAVDERWLLADSRHLLGEARRRYLAALPGQLHWPRQLTAWHRLHDSECDATLERGEQRAAEAGVELRVPLWSVPMLQFSISVPQRLLYSPGLDRPLHRRAMRVRLPEQVLTRADKAEFSTVSKAVMPEVVRWLSDNMPDCEEQGVDRSWVIRKLHDASINPMGDERWPLWTLFCVTAAQDDISF